VSTNRSRSFLPASLTSGSPILCLVVTPPAVTLLLLVRHALTDSTGKTLTGWTPGVHLSERGQEQAEELADRLAGAPISAVYSSPLERCRETTAPLAASAGLRVRTRADLGEVKYGEWTNRPLSQVSRTRLWVAVQSNPSSARFPGGESLLECQTRVAREAARIAAAHPGRAVVLVSHGDPIRLLLAHLAGVHTDHFQRLVVSPASVSAVAVGEGPPRILRVNDTGTLVDLVPPRLAQLRRTAHPKRMRG